MNEEMTRRSTRRPRFGGWLKGIFAAAALMFVVGVLVGVGFVPISVDLSDGRTLTALISGLEPAGWVVAAASLLFLALGLLRARHFRIAGVGLIWLAWLAYAGTIYLSTTDTLMRVRAARIDPPGEIVVLNAQQVAIVSDMFVILTLTVAAFAFLLAALVTGYLLRSAHVRAVYDGI